MSNNGMQPARLPRIEREGKWTHPNHAPRARARRTR